MPARVSNWYPAAFPQIDPRGGSVVGSATDPAVKKTRYEDLLRRVHWKLLPRTYLEIGVHSGGSLRFVLPNTEVIGIDPEPQIPFELRPGIHVYAETSDDFFANTDVLKVFRQPDLDLAFIDGLHLFEFALRDFINVERLMTPDGVVLIDDCHSDDPAEASRDRETPRWTGDVWKLIVCLRQYRPDLDVRVVDLAPAGVGVVTGLDPSSTVLTDAYDEILAAYVPRGYDTIAGRERQALNLQPFDWRLLSRSLPSAHASSAPLGVKMQAMLASSRLSLSRSSIGGLARTLKRAILGRGSPSTGPATT